MKKTILAVALTSLVFAGLAWSQNTVKADQGKPGNQGSWPVVISGTVPGAAAAVVGPDGGAVRVQDTQCSTVTGSQKITSVGVASTTTPATQMANRIYIELCNSLQNSGNPIVKCRIDGTAPVAAATNLGDVLGIGDCIRYTVSAGIIPLCISDAAATYVTSFECVGP